MSALELPERTHRNPLGPAIQSMNSSNMVVAGIGRVQNDVSECGEGTREKEILQTNNLKELWRWACVGEGSCIRSILSVM